MMKKFGYLFFEGKTDHFSYFCRFSAMMTVFIAMKIDFVAMKTVVITHGPGSSRQRRRSSLEFSAHLTETRRQKGFVVNETRLDIVRKYSILRDLSFIIFSCFSRLG
ncbi:hypothetical protein [uncultured Parabacteroides sp.]|uniref:hypothetical protein n=1 Tax=uncultured Parabacteroides sp. TaxID=512312 RepID=UPI00265B4C4B|nr:hypothetical protein [uncultured Parabacteroides sp.]